MHAALVDAFSGIGFGFGLCGLIAIIQLAFHKKEFNQLKEEVRKLQK